MISRVSAPALLDLRPAQTITPLGNTGHLTSSAPDRAPAGRRPRGRYPASWEGLPPATAARHSPLGSDGRACRRGIVTGKSAGSPEPGRSATCPSQILVVNLRRAGQLAGFGL